MWVRFSGRLERLCCRIFSKDSGEGSEAGSLTLPAQSASGQTGTAKLSRTGLNVGLMLGVLVACLGVASIASAQAPPDPATLVPVFVDPTAVLTVVQTKLTAVFLPFIMFSIGVMLLILIWRTGKRYAGGHS